MTFPTVTLEMTEGVSYRAYKDALGNQLPWRYCIAPPTDVHAQFIGPMVFDAQNISLRDGQRADGERPARLLRLRHLQPEHAGAPELRRPLLRGAALPVAAVKTMDVKGRTT